MDPVYHVPIIAQDLRQEENIIQIADMLEHLNNVIDDIFQKIDSRITANVNRTQNISRRISVCSDKVKQLAGTTKATQVFSPAKYPAMDCYKTCESIFSKGDVVLQRSRCNLKSKPPVYTHKQLQDKLEFYHVKMSCPDAYQHLLETPPPRNLGGLPPDVATVGALLLFNTATMLYSGQGRPRKPQRSPPVARLTDHQISDLGAAPFSISNRERGGKKAPDSYLYSPGMGEAPEMDMPRDLPHLAGIAGDMQFLSETGPVIAPSAAITPQEPPSPAPEPSVPQPQVTEETTASKPSISSEAVKEAPAVVAVPAVKEQKQPTGPPPPPPPPPPPAPRDASEPDYAKATAIPAKAKSNAPKKAPPLDSRANLMEAIRKAGGSGGAKLRHTDPEDKDDDQPKPVASSKGGDLMADLHAKLSMRRKGISGARAAQGTILEAISAMIPPPVLKASDAVSNSETSSADDDWD